MESGIAMLVMLAEQADRTVVRIVGRFDAAEAPRVSSVLAELGSLCPARKVVLDLSGVTFFDSHALQTVLNDRPPGPARFPVIAASGPVDLVYRLTGHPNGVGEAA